MNFLLKKRVALVITVLFLLLILHTPIVFSAELTNQEKGLVFLTEVIGLDLSKYNQTRVRVLNMSSDPDAIWQQTIEYTFESNGSKMLFYCNFKDDNIIICHVSSRAPLILVQPKTITLDAANSFLERYQTFSGFSYIQPLRDMLNSVTELKTATYTTDNTRLSVSVDTDAETNATSISTGWMNMVNGIYNQYNRIGLRFRNGEFERFFDAWNAFAVGNAEVNVDREKAINIAKEHAATYSYRIGDLTVSNMTVVDKPEFILTELTMQPRKNNLLYPEWKVRLPLDKVYPGMITEIRVKLLADTGEVVYIREVGSLGGPPLPPSENPSEPSEPDTEPQPENSTYIVAAATATTITAAAAVAIMLKKRRKNFENNV